MSITTEEMRYRQKLCEFAKKYGVTKAARRYHTNRQFVYVNVNIKMYKKWKIKMYNLGSTIHQLSYHQ